MSLFYLVVIRTFTFGLFKQFAQSVDGVEHERDLWAERFKVLFCKVSSVGVVPNFLGFLPLVAEFLGRPREMVSACMEIADFHGLKRS